MKLALSLLLLTSIAFAADTPAKKKAEAPAKKAPAKKVYPKNPTPTAANVRYGPAERNVLVVPGLLADPLLVTTAGGLVPADPDGGLKRDFENVVVFQYPTGRSLRESANHLYGALVEGAL